MLCFAGIRDVWRETGVMEREEMSGRKRDEDDGEKWKKGLEVRRVEQSTNRVQVGTDSERIQNISFSSSKLYLTLKGICESLVTSSNNPFLILELIILRDPSLTASGARVIDDAMGSTASLTRDCSGDQSTGQYVIKP